METERKYLDADLTRARGLLRRLGATTNGPCFESNILLDTEDFRLFKADSLLRLRQNVSARGTRSILTYKGPASVELARQNVKAREEIEAEVADYDSMLKLLAALGYRPVASYEKERESWRLGPGRVPGAPEACAIVELDHAPIGDVVEIEAEPGNIDIVGVALGLDKTKISLKSYYELHQDWLKANDLPESRDMLFTESEKALILARTGVPPQNDVE